jgi:hypothetical protein
MKTLQLDRYGNAVQGFAPSEIASLSAGGELDVTDVIAVRVSSPSEYKINGAGVEGTMSGTTVISGGVTSLVFTYATVVEVMK